MRSNSRAWTGPVAIEPCTFPMPQCALEANGFIFLIPRSRHDRSRWLTPQLRQSRSGCLTVRSRKNRSACLTPHAEPSMSPMPQRALEAMGFISLTPHSRHCRSRCLSVRLRHSLTQSILVAAVCSTNLYEGLGIPFGSLLVSLLPHRTVVIRNLCGPRPFFRPETIVRGPVL